MPYGEAVPTAPSPVLPAYGGACIDGVVRALLERRSGTPSWLPAPVAEARQVVLLTLDGLGWEQLKARTHLAPTLCSMTGGPITTVAPSTTATALTSLTTGEPPARHGAGTGQLEQRATKASLPPQDRNQKRAGAAGNVEDPAMPAEIVGRRQRRRHAG